MAMPIIVPSNGNPGMLQLVRPAGAPLPALVLLFTVVLVLVVMVLAVRVVKVLVDVTLVAVEIVVV